MRRTHRVAVDAFGGDVFAAPSLDGVIESKDQRPFRHKAHDQQTEQDVTRSQGRPARPIQDPVGNVADLHFMGLNLQSEFVPIHEQPNHNIVHLNRLGEANRLASQSLNPCT